MSAYLNGVKRAVIFVLAVVLALCYCAFDTLVRSACGSAFGIAASVIIHLVSFFPYIRNLISAY